MNDKVERAFKDGARAFMTNDKYARRFQEEALDGAFAVWLNQEGLADELERAIVAREAGAAAAERNKSTGSETLDEILADMGRLGEGLGELTRDLGRQSERLGKLAEEAEAMAGGSSGEVERLTKENAVLKKMLRDNNVCPYGMLPPGEPIGKCPAGFPGCSCGDDMMLDGLDELLGPDDDRD